MPLDTGMSVITVTEAGKDTTDKWFSKYPVDNKKGLPGNIVFKYLMPEKSFAYPIDNVVRAFSAISVENIFSRQIAITVTPSAAGLEAMEAIGDTETTENIVRKASFHLSIINGLPFLVSEDEDFLRFPIGQRSEGKGVFSASSMEKISTSAILESLAEMDKLNAELVNSVLPDKLNRLFLNIRAEEVVALYQFQSGLYEPYVTFAKRETTDYARDIGVVRVEGIKNKVFASSSNTLWQSTSRFSWEGKDPDITEPDTDPANAWSPYQGTKMNSSLLLPAKSSGKSFVDPRKLGIGIRPRRVSPQGSSSAEAAESIQPLRQELLGSTLRAPD